MSCATASSSDRKRISFHLSALTMFARVFSVGSPWTPFRAVDLVVMADLVTPIVVKYGQV